MQNNWQNFTQFGLQLKFAFRIRLLMFFKDMICWFFQNHQPCFSVLVAEHNFERKQIKPLDTSQTCKWRPYCEHRTGIFY